LSEERLLALSQTLGSLLVIVPNEIHPIAKLALSFALDALLK